MKDKAGKLLPRNDEYIYPQTVFISFDIDGLVPDYVRTPVHPYKVGLRQTEYFIFFKLLMQSGRKVVGFRFKWKLGGKP
jgi:arginase family enzyme